MSILDQAMALLPRGVAWTRRSGSGLHTLLTALTDELQRVEDRVEDALAEAMPATMTELLEDWVALAALKGLGTLDPDGPGGPLTVARQALQTHFSSRPLSRSRLRELMAIYATPANPIELVTVEVTSIEEATVTYGGDPDVTMQAKAEAEAHATGTLVWSTLDFVVEEDGITTVLEEDGTHLVVEEA